MDAKNSLYGAVDERAECVVSDEGGAWAIGRF